MNEKVENATNLYMQGIRDGRTREAITMITGEGYTQHSAGVKNGKDGFLPCYEGCMNLKDCS